MTLLTMRGGHPYYMYDAITGQPDAIARVIAEERDNIEGLAEVVRSASRVHIVGIGTSWHAALVGEDMLRTIGGRSDCRAWNSFEFCDRPPELDENDTVIVLSHRGTKTFSALALEMAHNSGARTGLLTGIGSDANRSLADVVVETSTPDPSSAFTISHTSAMTALAALGVELSGRDFSEALSDLPDLVEASVGTDEAVREWAAQSADVERFYFTGTRSNTATAYEVALKMKEANYTTTEGLQLEQYLHGPFISTDEGCLVTFIAPPSESEGDRTLEIINTVKAVGARTAAVVQVGDTARESSVDTAITVPMCADFLSPIVYLAPLQLFTYWLAVELGHNPDTFRLDDPRFAAAREHYVL